LPNWRTAEALLAAGRAQHVLSVCVEICSAAFYLDNDPGVLISACLFGDGAGAAVLSDYGNVRSPFVLFVLERALAESAPGGWWWLSSFGAGFSCHGALLKVD
jgi:predicted naringenin-chalcone synthase